MAKGPWNRRYWMGVVAAAAMAWGFAAGAAAGSGAVAMVTDLAGASRIEGSGGGRIALLAELVPGSRIVVDEGARLVIVYYESGDEYVFRGPANLRIDPRTPEVLSGVRPERRPSLLSEIGGEVTIRPTDVVQASLVMRASGSAAGLRLDRPVATRVLDPSPVFRWRPAPGAQTYHFELIDDDGRTLATADVAATEFRLPENIVLAPAVTYTWEVSARPASGAATSDWADFSVAPASDRALVERLRPPADAAFSRRVLFATVLERLELRDAARAYWRVLFGERGDEPTLRRLAGE
ncbi:MAG: hypothetical protein ACE5H8_11845 [Alphaproteobacteria bacterium]